MIKFNLKYFVFTLLVFVIEMLIERTSGFVRYTLGDFLAVILVYTLVKSFLDISVLKAGIIALGIAFAIEFLQLADLHEYYPENYKKIFGLILGSSFSFGDLIAYTCGVVTVIFFEYRYYLYRLKDKNGYN